MPRTKAPAKKPKINKKNADLARERIIDERMKQIEEFRDIINKELELAKETFFQKMNAQFRVSLLEIPFSIANKTIGELRDKWDSSTSMFSTTTASIMDILEVTKTRKRLRTSKSSCDEGYLTAESVTNGNSGGRQSRSKMRQQKVPRVSRSLTTVNKTSTTTKKPPRASSANKYKTPANKVPNPNAYGTVTPKVKPNTPQVLLRRPQVGEVVLSLQGSPLFTGSVVSETLANVNIPLEGGKMLSIQPQRGLRTSQIPDFDAETKRQLQMLMDNLNKVCAAAGVKH